MPELNLDLSQTTAISCDNCGNVTFEEIVMLRHVSAIVSPTGKDAIVPIPAFGCNVCGFVNDRFLPPALRMGSATPQADGDSTPPKTEAQEYTGPRLVTE